MLKEHKKRGIISADEIVIIIEAVMKKLLFIYNPNSGKGYIKNQLSGIIEKLCRAGYDITIYATGASKEATDMVVKRGGEFDVIACSGGDGTINEVVNGEMQLSNRPPIAYFPTGTVNDFARSLKIPKNVTKNVEYIIAGDIYSCDIGTFDNKYFNYVAGFGAFTEIAYETPQNRKNAMGKFAYFLDALRVLPEIHGYEMRIFTDQKTYEGEYIFGMICNSESVGGIKLERGKNTAMKMDDGEFELILIRNPKDAVELEATLRALMNRDTNNIYLDIVRTKTVRIICNEEVRYTLDGENGGSYKDVTAKCNYRAVNFFTQKVNE